MTIIFFVGNDVTNKELIYFQYTYNTIAYQPSKLDVSTIESNTYKNKVEKQILYNLSFLSYPTNIQRWKKTLNRIV